MESNVFLHYLTKIDFLDGIKPDLQNCPLVSAPFIIWRQKPTERNDGAIGFLGWQTCMAYVFGKEEEEEKKEVHSISRIHIFN